MDDRILDQHVAVLGKTGSGKTSTGKLLVERIAARGGRVCILDPIKSDWWGLTSSADGRAPGLPFTILGGPRGHVPLHSSAGAAIAELVCDGRLRQSILDMAEFEPGGQSRFFVDFAATLIKRMRGVLYLVLEEAHLFAPKERSGIGAENMAVHWAKTLATAGRSKGIRLLLLTQRTQALHNALLGSCDTMIAHRLTAPADQAPVMAWLKANVEPAIAREVAASLSSLKTGEAWTCSGEARIFERQRFPRIQTFDNSRTPTDDEHAQDVTTAKVDVDALRAIVGDAVKEAEENDPKRLKARIAELENGRAAPAPDGNALLAEFRRGLHVGRENAMEQIRRIVEPVMARFAAIAHETANTMSDFSREFDALRGKGAQGEVVNAEWSQPVMGNPIAGPEAKTRFRALEGNQDVGRARGGAELRILRVLASRHPARFTMPQWATLAGMKRTGGTWQTYVSRLRKAGYIEQFVGGHIGVTPLGMEAVGPVPRDPVDPISMWKAALGTGPARMLDVIIERKAVTREQLAAAVGMAASGGTFQTYLSRLRSNGVIEVDGHVIKPSPVLWS